MTLNYMIVALKTCFTLLVLLVFGVSNADAQYNYNNWEAGLGAGTLVYQGDLARSTLGSYKRLKPAFDVYVGKIISPDFSVRVNVAAGQIRADDADYATTAWRKSRNLHFSTAITELTAKAVFKPFGNNSASGSHLYPYLFAGIGAAFLHTKRDWSGMSPAMLERPSAAANLAADTNYHLPAVIPAVPVGGGMGYTLSPNISVFGEITYHLSITDYLDGFSNVGNAERKDNYYQWNFGLHWAFELQLKNGFTKCPPARL